jgi:hypothetical protein
MSITAQTFTLNIVMMLLDLMEHGGHTSHGVNAEGSPGGPLEFDRAQAALDNTFH